MLQRITTKLQNKGYFLLLLPLFFIVHGYNTYFNFLPVDFTIFNFTVILFFSALINWLSRKLLHQEKMGNVYSFFILLYLLGFGYIHDLLKSLSPGSFFTEYRFLLPVSFFLFLLLFGILKKSTFDLAKFYLFLNTVFILLLSFETIFIIRQYSLSKKGNNLIDARFSVYNNFQKTVQAKPDTSNPDIYFLVFDAMPSTQAMKEEWGFNNSLLDSFLNNNRFNTATSAKSNYNITVLSVSSMMNMCYLPPFNYNSDEIAMYFKAGASIIDNSLTRILANKNYQIRQYQPISLSGTDLPNPPFFQKMITMNFFYQTLPGRIYRDLSWNIYRIKLPYFRQHFISKIEKINNAHKQTVLKTADLVKETCAKEKEKPQFVYGHFMLPHEPYIFDSTGKIKPAQQTIIGSLSEEKQKEAFTEQVLYANKIIQDLITHIKTNNRRNTIIILAGDHGYRNLHGRKKYMTFDVLVSIYFPNNQYSNLYNNMSSVNIFRIVLNHATGSQLPLLKDSSIFINYNSPVNN